jgi:uncharacterized protein YjiS (DUF1127 family)
LTPNSVNNSFACNETLQGNGEGANEYNFQKCLPSGVEPPRGWLWALIIGLLKMEDRARQRRALARLDDRLLRDVGLSRADVEREYSRPFWR